MKEKEIQTITIIGQGNVGWHFYNALLSLKRDVVFLSSRGNNEKFLKRDLIILAVKDNAIEESLQNMDNVEGILVHCSGTKPMEVLSKRAKNYGVIYPVYSLKKDNQLSFSLIPLCIEANSSESLRKIENLFTSLGNKIYFLSSQKRKHLHISAIFANNFTNYLYGIAKKQLEKEDIPFEILTPIIDQTIENIEKNNPFDIQTGPAKRKDYQIMEEHKKLLDENERRIYEIISKGISSLQEEKEEKEEK
ncbi:MAG: DUF2520 domain-containing protein [Bacteroidales bacterium]|nr:DUF2520 domain-containing protein [Bacteroidales bacterium]